MAVSCSSIKSLLTSAFPHFSIIIAFLIIVGQLTIIGLVLISPKSLGIFETIYAHGSLNDSVPVLLNSQQATSLGIATIVIICEGVLFGFVSSYQHLRKSVFAAYHLHPAAETETDISPSTKSPLVQDGVDYSTFLDKQSRHVSIPSGFSLRAYFRLRSDVKTIVKKQLALYIAEIAFEVVQFLTKWILVLLVIRANWVSVGVTIVGGIYYPVVQFWKSLLATEQMKTIKPSVH